MAADLSIHALADPCTEDDLRSFFSNTLGSKYFAINVRAHEDSSWDRVAGTPSVWVGEVSWLKAAVTGDAAEYVPDVVSAVSEAVGEDLPVIDDALIERLRGAFAEAGNTTGYRVAEWPPVHVWLVANKGARAFTVSW